MDVVWIFCCSFLRKSVLVLQTESSFSHRVSLDQSSISYIYPLSNLGFIVKLSHFLSSQYVNWLCFCCKPNCPGVAGPTVKSATGLMEWGDVDLALDAFVLGNHHTLFAKSESHPSSSFISLPISRVYQLSIVRNAQVICRRRPLIVMLQMCVVLYKTTAFSPRILFANNNTLGTMRSF